jgi:hypothetical protein
MVVLAGELAQLRAEVGADLGHDLVAPVQDRAGQRAAPVPRGEDQMHVQLVHDRATSTDILIWVHRADIGQCKYNDRVRLTTQVKLLPTPEQAAALEATLRACNAAACEVAAVARETGTYRNYELRKHVYAGIKADYGLGAQRPST